MESNAQPGGHGAGVAPIDQRTGRERLTGQEPSVYRQDAEPPRVAGPQGRGGDLPGDRTVEELNQAAARTREIERARKLPEMQPNEVRREGTRKSNPWDTKPGTSMPIAAPAAPAVQMEPRKTNAWDRSVPSPKSTQTTAGIGPARIDKSADEQIAEGEKQPDQPRIQSEAEARDAGV